MYPKNSPWNKYLLRFSTLSIWIDFVLNSYDHWIVLVSLQIDITVLQRTSNHFKLEKKKWQKCIENYDNYLFRKDVLSIYYQLISKDWVKKWNSAIVIMGTTISLSFIKIRWKTKKTFSINSPFFLTKWSPYITKIISKMSIGFMGEFVVKIQNF